MSPLPYDSTESLLCEVVRAARAVIPHLKDVIKHVHAKDCKTFSGIAAINGTLDPKPYSDVKRSWNFRTVPSKTSRRVTGGRVKCVSARAPGRSVE